MRLIPSFFENIYKNKNYLIIFIFFSSIIFSLVFLIFFRNLGPFQHRVPGNDYTGLYEPVANNIIQGKGVTFEGRVPLHIGLGYPIILSGIFILAQRTGIDKLDLVVVFNVLLTAIASVFLFLLTSEIFNKRIAVIASLLWASYPFNLWFIKNPNTEVPFIPLLFAGIWLYVLTFKKRHLGFAFLGGCVLGLALFVRIIGLFLPLFLALSLFFFLEGEPKKRKLLFTVAVLIGTFVVIFPWRIYSISKTGNFFPLSTLGPSSVVVGITWLSGPGDSTVIPEDVIGLVERIKREDLSSFVKLSKFFGRELIEQPAPLLKLIGLKIVRPWYATSTRWYEGKILTVQLFYIISSLFGLLYIIKTDKDKIRYIIFLLSAVFYFWGMAFLNVSILRYMVPVMSIVIIFSAITVNIAVAAFIKKNRLWR